MVFGEVLTMEETERVDIGLRRMERSDIDAILALNRRVGGGRSYITYRDLVATDVGGPLDLSFVAEAHNHVVGFILARLAYLYIPFTEVCIIQGIMVDPDYQRHGIGGRLVEELTTHCQLEDISTVRALINERDTDLKMFFENMGFRRSVIINYDKTLES